MKLYNVDHSPYSTRVRMYIRKKKLNIDITAPPVALRTPEFAQRFPLGKVPILALDSGRSIPESWVIMQYLEELYPSPALQPNSIDDRADMQLLVRCADTHFGPSGLFPLFKRLVIPDGTKNAHAELAAFDVEMARLERLLASQGEIGSRPDSYGRYMFGT